jgi:hypothetical protein
MSEKVKGEVGYICRREIHIQGLNHSVIVSSDAHTDMLKDMAILGLNLLSEVRKIEGAV